MEHSGESKSRSAQNKKSLLAVGVLIMSLAALQSPLWRSATAGAPVAVRNGGAMLISSERPISAVALDQPGNATAEVVGDHEVLLRGKALGETQLKIISTDGHASVYHVIVQAESAKSRWGSPVSR